MSTQGPPSRTTGSTLAAWLIIAAILGFAGGGFIGVQTSGDAVAGQEPPPGTASPPPGGAQPPESPSTPTDDPEPAEGISITASSLSVTGTDRVTFTGSITPAEGGIELILWRSVDGGEWTIFPNADNPIDPFVTADDGTYNRYVQNLRSGDNTFKLVRADDESVESEAVTVVVSD